MSQSSRAEQAGSATDREEILAAVEPERRAVYRLVCRMLDDLEHAAPWDILYYPPAESEDFLRMQTLLIGVIDAFPAQVDALRQDIEAAAGLAADPSSLDHLAGDVRFFFGGIHDSVRQDLEQLRRMLAESQATPESITDEDRHFASEVAADVKGKYTSSIMGAAASLVAESRWNGVAIESVLFPEKASEFERNERLVATLAEVNENIGNLLQEVPLAELVASWTEHRRVDQYALTPLYSLLGNLGKLMQETSRRALYSGDYHQIQRREGLLSTRVHRLATLHNASWGMAAPDVSTEPAELYPQMVRAATELSAVLDLDILREILGERGVDDILRVVTLEKESAPEAVLWRGRTDASAITPHPARRRVPDEHLPLIPLLYDEDLSTFLELLLGSVLKRASLAVRHEAPADGMARDLSEALDLDPVNLDPANLDRGTLDPEAAATAPAEVTPPAHEVSDAEPVRGEAAQAEAPHVEAERTEPPPAEQVMPASIRYAGMESPSPPVGSSFDQALESLSGGLGLAEFDLPDLTSLGLRSPDDDDEDPPTGPTVSEQLEQLRELQRLLDRFLGGSRKRRQFEMILRLLRQKRSVPRAMMQSAQPYLFEVMNELVPLLERQGVADDVFHRYGAELMRHCKDLCRPETDPRRDQLDLPQVMQKVLNLLDGLNVAAGAAIEQLEE
ncbi:MAG: hypothetical protein AAGC60_21120 [Acidobacteriota bacterium]